MKAIFRSIMFMSILGLLFGCSTKQVKTIENLKAAYNGESTASAKYAAFAEKAKMEGFDTIAVMFLATSKSEATHAQNHKNVLDKLGEKVEGPQIGAFEVLTTAENLADAIKGETYEIETMYPGFITTAEEQNYPDAVESFTWAIETEKKHQVIYKTALEVVNTGSEKSLPSQWLVCLVCGNTYIDKDVPNECEFCMTSKEEFMVFK